MEKKACRKIKHPNSNYKNFYMVQIKAGVVKIIINLITTLTAISI